MTITVICVALYYWNAAGKYDIEAVAKLAKVSVIQDRDNIELSPYDGHHSELATRDELPEHILLALYAREDAKFKNHHGIDLKGLARATIRNVKDRKFSQGASTITMQLVKNTYNNRAKSINRKLLEIALTFRVEKHYSKDEIVTHYLNRIYFGSGCYGIVEASEKYFGKKPMDLHEGETALLVGIIRGPHIFSPLNNLPAALEQRDQVLKRMLDVGYINEQQHADILKLPITLSDKKKKERSSESYAVRSVRRHMKVVEDTQKIDTEGIVIRTSIIKRVNSSLDHQLKNFALNEKTKIQTAGIIIHPQSGGILAINGGADVKTSPYNIALDSPRQLGSILAPFIYLTAIERGFKVQLGQPILTGRQAGVNELTRICKRVGLPAVMPDSDDAYRGDTQATLLQLATAYATIANLGKRPHTYFISTVRDKNDTLIYTRPSNAKEAITERSAQALMKLISQGKFKQELSGTSLSRSDIWSIHISDQYVIVLWCGSDDGKRIDADKVKSLSQKLDSINASLKKQVHAALIGR